MWSSIILAFLVVRPNNKIPLVKRSNRWMVRKFFRLYSFAKMNTTVLCRYRPHGWTFKIQQKYCLNTRNITWSTFNMRTAYEIEWKSRGVGGHGKSEDNFVFAHVCATLRVLETFARATHIFDELISLYNFVHTREHWTYFRVDWKKRFWWISKTRV